MAFFFFHLHGRIHEPEASKQAPVLIREETASNYQYMSSAGVIHRDNT